MCSSTTFALRHTQISLSGILRHFRPPSRHLLLNTHDTNMEFLQLNGPLLDVFLFFSKTKIVHSHPCNIDNNDPIERRNSRCLQSPHCAMNCLRDVTSSGQGTIVCKSHAIVCKSHATHQVLITCTMLCAVSCKGTAQLLSLTELKLHLF